MFQCHFQATGRTPLMMAALSGSAKVVKETLRHGADVNVADKFGRTAGHEAARNGHLQVLFCLGGNGCDFDVVRFAVGICARSDSMPNDLRKLQSEV